MGYNLLSFQEALRDAKGFNRKHLLTGNGFSIACRSDIFRYDTLYEQADFSKLSFNVKKVFEVLNTKDFEIVMRNLIGAAKILAVYAPNEKSLISKFEKDAEDLKNVLVEAIASSHPENPSTISEDEYNCCKAFLSNFNNIYTLNYDLLLYWTTMHFMETKEIIADDGFRTPDEGRKEYVSWDIEKTNGQNIFYLHGALHVFDTGSELQKFTWINTGIKLIDQIRAALDSGSFPLFVSEGSSIEKESKIMHSNYLSRGLRSFANIGGCLFIYGHSLASNDSHILKLISKSKIERLYISIYGDILSEQNKEIVRVAETLQIMKRGIKMPQLAFYDASSANVWHPSV
ncbi:DUF4917 family protein [Pedobacter psychrodurus]|uniref:DUF4917 family protein n=1 Tax=Pedobacter psychrodurus TaxID=2530456 RepID=A0A4R0PPA8_9SPHI|nr:DUF4917 family protein [Pedobacter psychrodurus]TCD17615.1 DUF4917 family protein [Pedobacter psychrodurus]